MRRADLIKGEPAPFPRGYKKDRPVTILTGKLLKIDGSKIVETDIYSGGRLTARHFTSKSMFWDWDALTHKWSGKPLGNHFGYYADERVDFETKIYTQITHDFTKNKRFASPYSWRAIKHIEDNISYEKWRSAEIKRYGRINRRMQEITPALPRGFHSYLKDMLPKSEKKKALVCLYQALGDGRYMERYFRIDNKCGEALITEQLRAVVSSPGEFWDEWYYGEYIGRYGKRNNRQWFWYKKTPSILNSCSCNRYLYIGNLAEWGFTPRQQETIKQLAAFNVPCKWGQVLESIKSNDEFKLYLARDLKKLTIERMQCKGCFERGGDGKPLGITPQKAAYIREIDGGWRSIQLLQADVKGKLRPKDLRIIESVVTTYTVDRWKKIINEDLPFFHAYTLLATATGRVTPESIGKYLDYLAMAKARGADIHDEIIYRNKRWEEFHDRYVEELNARKEAERIERRKKECAQKASKFKGIRTGYKKNCSIFAWECGDYVFSVPKTYEDIITEGQRQHHCVGASDTYMLKMALRESFIVFLRHKGTPDKPYYTIEATEKEVKQAYGAYDWKPDWEQVKPVIDRWIKRVRVNAKKAEKAGR